MLHNSAAVSGFSQRTLTVPEPGTMVWGSAARNDNTSLFVSTVAGS